MGDVFDLDRFIQAQEPVYARVLQELSAARKTSHWMWFVFPQIAGLGHSPMAMRYAIGSLAEARAYLAHPVLGERLHRCLALVNQAAGQSARAIFGQPDDLKFRSCVTLFSQAAPADATFVIALDQFFDGRFDPATLARLS